MLVVDASVVVEACLGRPRSGLWEIG